MEKFEGAAWGRHSGGGCGDVGWGAPPPPLPMPFSCPITMASWVQPKEAGQLVAFYAYRFLGGYQKLETTVPGRLGVAEGTLVRFGVLPITGLRGWGDCMEAHIGHAWLMMRSRAQGDTRVHSGELGAVEGGNKDKDDARSGISAGSKALTRGWGGHRTGPLSPLSPPPPPLLKSRWIGCCSNGPSPSGNSGWCRWRGRFCS